MVNNAIVNLIQTKIDLILADLQDSSKPIYDENFIGVDCQVNGEYNYNFERAIPKHIVANIVFGGASKNNDLEDKYSMGFVINIQSEINGGELAKKLFDILFKTTTRTYPQLDTYDSKIFLTSPTLMNPYFEIEDSFCCLYTMNCNVEFSERVVLGCKYYLSIDNTNYSEFKLRQPYCMKEAIGGTDLNYSNQSEVKFTKSGNSLTINMTLLYEQITVESPNTLTTEQTRFNTIMTTLLNECYGASSQSYSFKATINGSDKVISNLVCVRGQHIYDETTGENVLSLQFKVGA